MQSFCAPSHRITAYQTSGVLIDHRSREKQFTVLRYHVTCNNRCAHKSQEQKITCDKAFGGTALPSIPP